MFSSPQFYNEQEAKKYSQNSRMIEIQTQMSERAVELLNLPEGQSCYLLDVGISALQWLCNADKRTHSPPKRLYRFFSTLYSSLSRGSRAVFQLYPENSEQLELITTQAMKAGFSGGMVVDYPNSSKAKKSVATGSFYQSHLYLYITAIDCILIDCEIGTSVAESCLIRTR
ncbi:hypothetical protein fugu_011146 [Takifugu bimaculatus]|uniref:Uncharacterized protein n=1 Tax=Takifugu bimaculatus TaxID=433685 RepID=A0A4Z2CC98_9TELE|nr:hypothetical protein fugu_011146 [Takifugu bimaculatus]